MAKKFYAVAVGRKTGLYTSWADCEKQVRGFSKAIYKSFPSKEDAEAFIQNHNGHNTASSTKSNKRNPSESQQTPSAKKQRIKGEKENVLPKKTTNSDKSYEIKMILHFDGGSRGNGQYKHTIAGAGALLIIHSMFGQETIKIRKFLDRKNYKGAQMSNNFAEYSGLIAGLHKAKNRFVSLRKEFKEKKSIQTSLNIFGDSFLVVNQMNKQYECRSCNLIRLYKEAMILLEEMEKEGFDVLVEHIYRDKNTEADALANEAMDLKKSWETVTSTKTSEVFTKSKNINDPTVHESQKDVKNSVIHV